MKLIEVRVKYTLIDEETGKEKKVNNIYLLDAFTPTEAEAKITRELNEMGINDFNLNQTKIVDFELLLNEEKDWIYKAKTDYIFDNDGKPKAASYNLLVSADNFDEALSVVNKMKEELSYDAEINKIEKTKIVDVFVNE